MHAKYSFYVPHDPVVMETTITDPVTGEVTTPPSMTKQSFLAECDINNILKQYKLTGQISHMSAQAAQGAYRDLPDPQDFQESLNIILAAEQSFSTLPSSVRDRFGNDPTAFLSFMSDPTNQDEIIKMGLGTDSRPPALPPSPTPTPTPEPPPAPK